MEIWEDSGAAAVDGYGGVYWARGDYQEGFLRRVSELEVEIRMGCNVNFGVGL
jgi:hypothetical protein